MGEIYEDGYESTPLCHQPHDPNVHAPLILQCDADHGIGNRGFNISGRADGLYRLWMHGHTRNDYQMTTGARGYLFAHNQASVYRYNANGTRSEFLTASPGFNDVEFGANRTLYVADLYNGLYEVKPSPRVFSGWLEATRGPLICANPC